MVITWTPDDISQRHTLGICKHLNYKLDRFAESTVLYPATIQATGT
jgi:hypothetical protein